MNVRLFLDIFNELDKFNATMTEWDQIDNIKENIVTLIEGQEEIIENLQKEIKLKKYQEEVHVETILQLRDENKKLFNEKEKIREEFKKLNKAVCEMEDRENETVKQIVVSTNKVNKNNNKVNVNPYEMLGITANPISKEDCDTIVEGVKLKELADMLIAIEEEDKLFVNVRGKEYIVYDYDWATDDKFVLKA